MTPTPPPQMTSSYAKASEDTVEAEAREIVAWFMTHDHVNYDGLRERIAAALRARAAPPASAEVAEMVKYFRAPKKSDAAGMFVVVSGKACEDAAALLLRLDARVKEVEGERDRLTQNEGDWTGKPCPKCDGSGETADALKCQTCSGTGEQWLSWKKRASAAEPRLRLAEEVVRAAQKVDRFNPIGGAHQCIVELRDALHAYIPAKPGNAK